VGELQFKGQLGQPFIFATRPRLADEDNVPA